MNPQELKSRLKARLELYEARWPEIAEKTKVPLPTIIKVGKGYTKNPRIGTALPILDVLDQFDAEQRQ